MDRIVGSILFILVIIAIIGLCVYGIIDSENYIYVCTDTQGRTIYCTSAYTSKGGMFGTMKDGTKVTITSYKQVRKEAEW